MARNAILGIKEGYRNHPQLERFKRQDDPVLSIDTYLIHVYNESKRRKYNFDREKIGFKFTESKIDITNGQMMYELKHLKRKLKLRDIERYKELKKIKFPDPNPIFRVIEGDIESWERPY